MTRTMLVAASLLALLATPQERARAQYYKGKTITMIVNYPAGGPTDMEGRIVAQHLPQHIPGNPTIVVRNVGGAGGLIGSNQLGEATPNGETIGFFTLAMNDQLLGNTAMRRRYSDFVLIAGIECPLVVYMRKDTPPGINVATDVMKAKDFKALSLNAQSSNTLNMALALELLGVKYHAVPAYRGLKDVETGILQNLGQMANSSLSGWSGSVEPTMGHLVLPMWQLSPRAKRRQLSAQQGPAQSADLRGILCEGFARQVAQGTGRIRGVARARRPAACDVPRGDDAAEGIGGVGRDPARRHSRRCGRARSSSPTIRASSRPSRSWCPAPRVRRCWRRSVAYRRSTRTTSPPPSAR